MTVLVRLHSAIGRVRRYRSTFRGFFYLAAAGVLWGCSSQNPLTIAPPDEPAPPANVVLPDIPLGPGDEFDVIVYRAPDLRRSFRIPRSGVIFMPLVGELRASGLTANELRRRLTKGLEPYVVDAQVSVEMTAHRSQKVVVLGEVRSPGVFTLENPVGTLEAIAMSGGFLTSANQKRVVLLHQAVGELTAEIVSLDPLSNDGLRRNPMLVAGDVVYVPPTDIVNWARYARNLEYVLRPILLFQQAILLGFDVKDAIEGERRSPSTIITLPADSDAP